MARTMESVYAQYPLKFADEQIRLLKIFPGRWGEPIIGNFCIGSLRRDTPEYIALSYVWGDCSGKQPSIIGGQEFHITNNLHVALRRLRDMAQSLDTDLVIWVDALCINQSVIEERNQQVRLMGKIYSKCHHVSIWLGELPVPDSEGEYPTARAVSLYCEQTLSQLAGGSHLTDTLPFSYGKSSSYFEAIYQAFVFLNSNPWFSRRWVLQEAVMAPCAQVVFGMVSIDLDILSRAMETIVVHTEERCCLSSLPGHYDLRHTIRGFLQRFIPIENLRYLKNSRLCLMDLCLRFLDCHVSEEHDRVYALLGMVNPPSQLVPDYGTPIRHLFTSICLSHIKNSSLPFPLHLASLDHETAGLPSWVIDWKFIGSRRMKVWHQICGDFKAGGTSTQTLMVDSRQRLHLIGWKVDQVDVIGELIGHIWQSQDNSRDAFSQDLNFQLWRSYISARYTWNDPYPSGGTWAMAWWRTLSADSCWGANSARRMTQRDVDFFSSTLLRYTKSAGIGDRNTGKYIDSDSFELEDRRRVPADAHYNDIMGMSATILNGARFFSTQKGYLGISRGPVLVGDQIFIIPGCRTPMLLRTLENSAGRICEDLRQVPYSIVGFCYVHGAMDGELVGGQDTLESIAVV